MNQRLQESQDPKPKPKPELVKVLAKHQAPPPELPEPQSDLPMDNYEQFKEAGFSDKQSVCLANVIGKICKDIEKLTNYMIARFEAMDKRLDAMDKRFDAMDKRFDAIDRKIDNLVKVIMWATGILVAMALGVLGLVMQGFYLFVGM